MLSKSLGNMPSAFDSALMLISAELAGAGTANWGRAWQDIDLLNMDRENRVKNPVEALVFSSKSTSEAEILIILQYDNTSTTTWPPNHRKSRKGTPHIPYLDGDSAQNLKTSSVEGWVAGPVIIVPLPDSILQAETCQMLSLAENPRWSPSVAKTAIPISTVIPYHSSYDVYHLIFDTLHATLRFNSL